ncbi:MAG TPA: hypothetical protein VFQ35_05975 [Polyangiaceae bacterium]|nr:hypothetical protein [Polyangiaceae bacterium]
MRFIAHSLVLFSLLGVACAQKEAPVAAPSGEQAGFAERYPARLNGARTHFASDENQARATLGEFKGYPDALKNPDWNSVHTLVEQADSTGKSSAYTEAALEAETVTRFFDEEKDGLRQKVGGSVSYASTQKKCEEDLGGTAVAAMERGVDKQLEERMRAHSEAHRYIEDHEDELGKQNVETLKKQADKIARTSNIAYVRLELYRREVEILLNDDSNVRSTLDRTIQESDATLANASASKSKKAAAQKRKDAAQKARAALDAEVEQDRRGLEEMQQRINTLQNDYRAALDALLADVKTRADMKK